MISAPGVVSLVPAMAKPCAHAPGAESRRRLAGRSAAGMSAALVSVVTRRAATKRIPGLLRRILDCSDGFALLPNARPLRVAGESLGLVLPQAAKQLQRFPEVFEVTETSVELLAGNSVETRSEAVAAVLQQLREEDAVPMLRGWRDEAWPVKGSFHQPPALVIERAAGPFFGVPGFGCHINGIVEDKLWVAKRAQSKPTYPGHLDHLVAGGLSEGELPRENVIRECWEEARVPKEVASRASPAGVVSYVSEDETGWGIKRDVLFCYDLMLPADFEPTAGDGEVESFHLMGVDEVVASLVSEEARWKPNVALVIIDMLVRRGFLTPEEDGYVELVHALRRG
eukprot:s51_g27.t1